MNKMKKEHTQQLMKKIAKTYVLIKTFNKLGLEGNYLHIMLIYSKTPVIFVFGSKWLKVFI